MIYKKPPETWQELQQKVHETFLMIGYDSQITKTIKLVRGEKEVDVYAVNRLLKPEQLIIVECKFWRSKIPQNEVHAFRTVVADCGANIGLLISNNGFQKGCNSAIEKTNIKLLDWESFNQLYLQEYFIQKMLQTRKYFELFTDYTEPINTRITKLVNSLPDNKKQLYDILKKRYFGLGFIITNYPYSMICYKDDLSQYMNFPISIPIDCNEVDNINYISVYSVEEFFEIIIKYHDKAMREFQEVFG